MLAFIVAFIIAWVALSFLEVFLGEASGVLGHFLSGREAGFWELVVGIGGLWALVHYGVIKDVTAVMLGFFVLCPAIIVIGRSKQP